ncbi:MAG: dehydrogenase, partial [Cyclobacteriaceae bacterium]
MNNQENSKTDPLTRRSFIRKSAQLGAATIMAGNSYVFAGASDTIRVGLIGTGGRGTGAGIIDCAESSSGVELVAMGDLFQDHIDDAPSRIKANLEKRGLPVDEIYKVTEDSTFVGFDAYQKVIDSDVDMVILTTPPNFRPLHFKA